MCISFDEREKIYEVVVCRVTCSPSHTMQRAVCAGGEGTNRVLNLLNWIMHTQRRHMETQWVGVMPDRLAYFSGSKKQSDSGHWLSQWWCTVRVTHNHAVTLQERTCMSRDMQHKRIKISIRDARSYTRAHRHTQRYGC